MQFKPLIYAALLLVVTVQPASPAPPRSQAQQVLKLVNQIRRQHHLRPLRISKPLSRSAVKYAWQMGKQNFFGHTIRILLGPGVWNEAVGRLFYRDVQDV